MRVASERIWGGVDRGIKGTRGRGVESEIVDIHSHVPTDVAGVGTVSKVGAASSPVDALVIALRKQVIIGVWGFDWPSDCVAVLAWLCVAVVVALVVWEACLFFFYMCRSRCASCGNPSSSPPWSHHISSLPSLFILTRFALFVAKRCSPVILSFSG